MANLIKILLISISILSMSCSKAGLTDKLARGPILNIQLEQENIYVDIADKNPFKYYANSRITIESLTPVICKGSNNNVFVSGHCSLDEDKPLPEKIGFRYGV